jgi:hypothetical protein
MARALITVVKFLNVKTGVRRLLVSQRERRKPEAVHHILVDASLTIVEHKHRYGGQCANKEHTSQILEKAEIQAHTHTHLCHFADACAAPTRMPTFELAVCEMLANFVH